VELPPLACPMTTRLSSDAADVQSHPFTTVRPRCSVDELLRNVHQALVAYTGQADLTANIIVTTSSLFLTIVATRWSEQPVFVAGALAPRVASFA
jgi:hypothetical protein